ncbi:MAG: hypothetical protein K1X51_08645 [Rhodospirillaceae bacterium]|nr:hypothetical protein [Rhodospirillaceae bacterium]
MARRRPERVMLASFILMLGIAAYQFNTEGYGVLIGSDRAQPEGESKLVRLSCTYFTGTEKVITHVMRAGSDDKSKAGCGFFTKLPKVKNDPYEIIPGEKSIPIGPAKSAPPPELPAVPSAAPEAPKP